MTKRGIGRGITFIVLMSILLGSGCGDDLVLIHYSQPANAYVFDTDPTGSPHTTTSAGDGLFAFYCINKIENIDKNARDFKLELSRVSARTDPDSEPGNTSFSYLVQTAPDTLNVPAHTTSGPSGRFVIKIAGVLDIEHLDMTLYVDYESVGEESVLMVNDDDATKSHPTFLDPASPIHPNNLPVCP